ncbi:hypothetical protein B0T16DRAFT_130729 [Cercophora newfieldiana]|uniref:Uncharacterized protein n=1 Tax=Cercophora newfieldiana TaxID=92897 RepID=A0AA39YDD4_9PEZI|nr:hypothetical protein B0T16DRAFT_130729 [Cercophora newfieldiana]
MSSSITIPAPTAASALDYDHCHRRQSSKSTNGSSSSSSSYSSSPTTPEVKSSSTSSRSAQKRKMVHARRPSLLSSAFAKEEYTTINIADDPEGPPRLISYLSSSQGFAWNPELFLPSYVDFEYTPLEYRQERVVEICLSDEDIKKILPQ